MSLANTEKKEKIHNTFLLQKSFFTDEIFTHDQVMKTTELRWGLSSFSKIFHRLTGLTAVTFVFHFKGNTKFVVISRGFISSNVDCALEVNDVGAELDGPGVV